MGTRCDLCPRADSGPQSAQAVDFTDIRGVRVDDLGIERCGIVSLTKTDIEADDIKAELTEDAINVSTSSSSSTLLDMQARDIESVVRASVHYYNTEEEVKKFAEAVAEIG